MKSTLLQAQNFKTGNTDLNVKNVLFNVAVLFYSPCMTVFFVDRITDERPGCTI